MQVYKFFRIADVAEGERQTGRQDEHCERGGAHVSAHAMGRAAGGTGLLPVQFGLVAGCVALSFGVNHSIWCQVPSWFWGCRGGELQVLSVHMHSREL